MRLLAWVVALLAAAIPSLAAAQDKPAASDKPAAQDKPSAPPAAVVVERIPLDELKKLLAANKVLVVDVRSAEAYTAGHIPGAVSAPLLEIEKHVQELKSAKKPIVTYCA